MRRLALGLLALAALAAPAAATIRNDAIKLRCAGPAPVLEPGKPATIPVEMLAARRATVTNLSVESASLARAFARRAAPVTLDAGGALRFDLEVLPDANPAPLVIRYDVDGEPFEQTVDLAPRLSGEIAKRRMMVQVPDQPLPAPASPMTRTRPERPNPDGWTNPSPPTTDNTTIWAHGRVGYYRDDGVFVGADRVWVHLYDEDLFVDQRLYSGYTDNQGNFSFFAEWTLLDMLSDGYPDLYLEIETDSPEVRVQSPFWEVDYSWRTPTHEETPTYGYDLGTWTPPTDAGALHIFTNIQHNWDWYWYQQSYSLASVDVQWPDGSNAYYQPFWEEIHIGSDRTWNDATHAHELGHHWVENYAVNPTPDYCNGICDQGSCGHCLWCPETDHDALNEGWPNWIAHVQTSSYLGTYGVAARFTRDQESVVSCGAIGGFGDPAITEGFIGAILQDIWDAANDSDPNRLGQVDALALGTEELFEVMDLDHPETPLEFLADLKTRFPQYTSDLWRTAMNNRLNLDTVAPTTPTGLASTSHTPGVPLMNAQVVLTWNASSDNWSGIDGYDLLVDYSSGPDVTFNLTASTLAGTGYLPPGTYMLGVRARDRGGLTSAYAWSGPYVITAPDPQNLAFTQPAGWARPVVARSTGDATAGSVPNPVTLTGNSASTWLNVALTNNGQTVPNLIFATHSFYVDDASMQSFVASPDPGVTATRVNRGPVAVRGGRHVVSAYLDALAAWPETSESDNTWGHPWIWSPLALASGVPVRRAAPPPATAGWSFVHDGSPLFDNCDGLRMSGSGWWNATWIAADRDTSDYDLRLHFSTSSVDTGFAVPIATSSRGAGELDLVVVNRRQMAQATWDVGAVSHHGDEGTYVARHVESAAFAFGDSLAIAWPDSQYALLREVNVAGANLGLCVATATGVPADGPFRLAVLDRTFRFGGLSDPVIALVASDSSGRARVAFNAASAGDWCVLLVRDPVAGRGARTVVLDIEKMLPNPELAMGAAGWHAPLVPRLAQDGTPASVPMPDTLDGTAFSTYLNLRAVNSSTALSPFGVGYQVRADGVALQTSILTSIAAGGEFVNNSPSPVLVLGGRHTLTAALDHGALLDELEESDNVWGEQWVWGPYVMAAEQPLAWGPPPARTGGWSDVRSGEPLFFNTLGMRTEPLGAGSAWAGVAVMPGTGSDVDLGIYPLAGGVKSGFDTPLALSAWGPDQLEFVLFDAASGQHPSRDVGLVNVNGVAQGPSVLLTRATPRGLGATGGTLATNRSMDLHEFSLPAGTVRVRLTSHSGVNLGVSAHEPVSGPQTKSQSLYATWVGNPVDEFLFVAPAAGTYAVAVWKPTRAELSFAASYTLEVIHETVAVEGEAPLATRLAFAAPNPFAASTALAFDLASAADVALEVFDLRGGRVATLARGRWAAGRHRLTWDGRSDSGREVAAGIYLVRLTAPGFSQTRRVARLP